MKARIAHPACTCFDLARHLLFAASAILSSYKLSIKLTRLAPLPKHRQLFEKEPSTCTYLLSDLAGPNKPDVTTTFLEPSLVQFCVSLIQSLFCLMLVLFGCIFWHSDLTSFILCLNYSNRVLKICVFRFRSPL